MVKAGDTTTTAAGAGLVLMTLSAGQFLMTLDSSVMNVSIAQVAEDVGTTVTGVQTAITLYTLVMATMMITGGKIGSIIGRKKAFTIGCVIYAAGSLTTALAQNLTVLIIGWSFLEGIGAALIMPAIVALVASNFAAAERPQGLRPGGLRRGHRGRGRSPDRRSGDDALDLAPGVRRRGRHRRGDRPAHPTDPGRRRPRARAHASTSRAWSSRRPVSAWRSSACCGPAEWGWVLAKDVRAVAVGALVHRRGSSSAAP